MLDGLCGQQPFEPDERFVGEGQHEGEEVKRQRHDPQERRRRHVGRNMRRHRDEQARRHKSQHDPEHARAPAYRGGGCCLRGGGLPRHRERQHAACRDAQRQQRIAHRPDARLRGKPPHRLDEKRIGQQHRERSEIGSAVKEIGIGRVLVRRAREPGLQQRRVGGDREERQSDRSEEQSHQPQRNTLFGRRGKSRGDRHRQAERRRDQHAQMHQRSGAQRKV